MSSSLDVVSLESFLQEANIPEIRPRPKTFLGIAKQPHYENVISNIYAFYFDVNEEHGLKSIFVESLIEIIMKSTIGTTKTGLKDFQDFVITTELGTTDGGRIDLLLHNNDQAIIIENKIYHHLINDLKDYWNSVKRPAKNKIGIVLSLFPISRTGHSDFINITHLEFIKEIQSRLGNFLLEANQKYLVFLQDFFQNIINMSTKQLGAKELQFYFTHLSKIQDVKNLDAKVYEHIVNQIQLAGNQMQDLNLFGPRANSELEKRVRYYVCPKNANLVIAVIFDRVIEEKKLLLKVQLKNDLLNERGKFKDLSYSDAELALINNDFYTDPNLSWSDFAVKEYTLTMENITELADFIIQRLEKDNFISIFRKLEAVVAKKQPI